MNLRSLALPADAMAAAVRRAAPQLGAVPARLKDLIIPVQNAMPA